MPKLFDRVADLATATDADYRIVMLRASWETQDKLREWAKQYGFDLSWSYNGWPQSSFDFDFHITLVASSNKVKIPDGVRFIDPLTVTPAGFGILGVDQKVPVLKIEPDDKLKAMRDFFIQAYGVKPTFDGFIPHISLSYKWDGQPAIEEGQPEFPDFPLVFDLLMVSTMDPPSKTEDAKTSRKILSYADKAAPIPSTRRTADGYLVTEARVARGGNIQEYYGHEIGEGEPNQLFKVWRPEDEIFRRESLATFAHKPVTLSHPDIGVSPENFKDEAVGHLGSEVIRDGEFVRVPLVVMDADAIKAIENGTREISMGYDCELVVQAGTTPDGRAYDAYQKNIRVNHCAIVEAGRAGPACRIGDQARTPRARTHKPQKDTIPMTKTVTIDGKAFEVTDEVAAAIAKVDATLTTALSTMDTQKTAIDALKADKAKLEADLADANKKVADAPKPLTADEIHALATELATTMDKAKKVAPDLDPKGKTADAIRKEAVSKKLGDAAVKGKDQAYFNAMFDVLAMSDDDPVAKALKAGPKTVGDEGDKAFNDYVAGLSKAWQTPVAKAN
jgi:hypothetical protein